MSGMTAHKPSLQLKQTTQNRKDDYMTKTAQQSAQPPKLVTMNGNALLNTQFASLRFTAEKILPHGLFILAGSPKIGKSWLALDLCRAVATGESQGNRAVQSAWVGCVGADYG